MPTAVLIGGGSDPGLWAGVENPSPAISFGEVAVAFDTVKVVDPGTGYVNTVADTAYWTGNLFPAAASGLPASFTWSFTVQPTPLEGDEAFETWLWEARLLSHSAADPEFWSTLCRVTYQYGNWKSGSIPENWSLSLAFCGRGSFQNQESGAPRLAASIDPIAVAVAWDEPSATATVTLSQGLVTHEVALVDPTFVPDPPARTFARMTVQSGDDTVAGGLTSGTYRDMTATWADEGPPAGGLRVRGVSVEMCGAAPC